MHGTSAALPRRTLLTALAVAGAAGTTLMAGGPRAVAATGGKTGTGGGASTGGGGSMPSPGKIAAEIRDEFLHGWNGYKQYAWGHDQVLPVSGGSNEFFADGYPVGLSIIEALDTLYLLGLDHELAIAKKWVTTELDLNIDADFHVFEAIIRVVGGLISGYLTTRDRKLLELAVDAADRLMPAFTKSPTGMPYTQCNMATGAVSGSTPPLAEIGTNILEFGILSKLTGDGKYYAAAKKAFRAALSQRSEIGLLPTYFDVETGRPTDGSSQAPNPPVDSFYEYLWGGWVLFGDRDLLKWWNETTKAILKYQSVKVGGDLWFRQVDYATGAETGTSASELGSFYAGLLGKAGDLTAARGYYDGWTGVLDRYPVLPEEIDYSTGKVTSASNNLRPEYVNSSFDLYQTTRDPRYRATAYQYFVGMRDNLRVPGGYTIANDVTTSPMQLGDLTQAYWFSENMKYLYLTFADTPRYDYRTGYLSTEGNIFRGVRRTG
ncbi:glycoside hydrolase family 47 protein [Streptomyces sp. NPDC090306]|uniref:glycoside hydrolase family 47 protein n=1 Tax=Streptomyces sp. NPDC090306 TaxID=3365961 RepID=UPI003800DA9C